MAFKEQIPNPASLDSQNKLGEMLDEVQSNLCILTTFGKQQPRSEFISDEEYELYCDGLRFNRDSRSIIQVVNGRQHQKFGLVMDAKRLQAQGQDGWSAEIFIPDDSMPLTSGRVVKRYKMNVLHREKDDLESDKFVTVVCSEDLDNIGPRLMYRNPQGLTSREIIIDNSVIEDSYPFHVVTQITEQIKREADALLALVFDGKTE